MYIGVIASGYLPNGQTAGFHATTVDGCVAVFTGTVGNWQITLSSPNNDVIDSDVVVLCSPAPGSNPSGGVTFGVGSGGGPGNGVYDVHAYAAAAPNAPIDVPYYFEVRRRR